MRWGRVGRCHRNVRIFMHWVQECETVEREPPMPYSPGKSMSTDCSNTRFPDFGLGQKNSNTCQISWTEYASSRESINTHALILMPEIIISSLLE